MKTLKRIRYNTMNSWNNSTAPAYNLKIYNVIDNDLQDKVYELMDSPDFYDEINMLIQDFDIQFDYQWQAGFNGRSGGYLVLYRGGCNQKTITDKDFNSQGMCYVSDRYHWKTKNEVKKMGLFNKPFISSVYSQPGKHIDDDEVPTDVKKAFRQLAVDIVKQTEYMAKNCNIENETFLVEKTVKVIR